MYRLVIFFLLFPCLSFSQAVPYRQYKAGETYRYRLTTEVLRNNALVKTISVSEHKVVKEADVFWEEIRWLAKTSFTEKDTTVNDSIARTVQPYRISLSPRGSVPLPKLYIPEMVGEITDLNTFFVAVSPELHIRKLSPAHPVFASKEVKEGNFTDSVMILYGRDCVEITQHLVSSTKEFTVIKTEFLPPAKMCLQPLIDTIATQFLDHPNNFQMVQRGAGDKVMLFWGVESFTITSKIDNKSGQVVEASMTNNLNLKMRFNVSADLKTHAVEMPFAIKRNLKLELIQ